MIKMIVSDLDGTLLRSDFSLSVINVEVIKKLIQQEILFLPASGRCFSDIQTIFSPHGISCGAIEVNGAQVRDEKGRILLSNKLSSTQVERCISLMEQMGLSIQIFSEEGVFAYKDALNVQKDIDAVISRNMGKTAISKLMPELSKQDLVFQSVLKLETMNMNEEKIKLCVKLLEDVSNLCVSSSVRGNLEITNIAANKGDALRMLIDDLNIKEDEVIIFGDSMNDASLFENFPLTVAVENAHPYIKEHASQICASCDKDGVGQWLKEHLCG